MSNERKRSEGTRGCQPLEQTTVSFSCSFSHSSERKWCWSWFRGKQQNVVASSDQSDVSKKGVPIFRVKHISRPLPFWGNVSLYTSRSLPFSGLFLMSRSHNLSFSFTWLDSWHNNFRTRSLVSFRAIVSSLSSHSYFVSPFNASFSPTPLPLKTSFSTRSHSPFSFLTTKCFSCSCRIWRELLESVVVIERLLTWHQVAADLS